MSSNFQLTQQKIYWQSHGQAFFFLKKARPKDASASPLDPWNPFFDSPQLDLGSVETPNRITQQNTPALQGINFNVTQSEFHLKVSRLDRSLKFART